MKLENNNNKDKTPVTDPNYWDCECEDKYIHHKSARKECPKCGTFQEDQPDSRVNEIADKSNIGTDAFKIEVKWTAVAPMLITILHDSTSPEDILWAESVITKMAEWIDWAQPELKKLSTVEDMIETNTSVDWTDADAGAEFSSIHDFLKGGEAEDNSTHTDIQMSLRYDEGDEEYHVDSRFDVVRSRDGESMSEAYETGQIFSTYAEALSAYYKLGHEYEQALTAEHWSLIGDGTVPDNPKQVLWSNEVEQDIVATSTKSFHNQGPNLADLYNQVKKHFHPES